MHTYTYYPRQPYNYRMSTNKHRFLYISLAVVKMHMNIMAEIEKEEVEFLC